MRDYIYVEDLAELCVRAAQSNTTGVFNAGFGQGLSINDVIAQVSHTSGKVLNVTYSEGRKLDVPTSVLDITAATQTFSWMPRTDFARGVQQHWDWLHSVPG